ncbi:MAG: hypothetical protein ABI679_06050 [Gemmatimonadota bacterium]
MTWKPAIWRPIATVLSIINVGAAFFAARSTEPMHAVVHAGLAVAFGVWAQRLSLISSGREVESGLEALEFEVSRMRQELSEAQERLDFVERMLAQGPDTRRLWEERQEP